MVSNVLLMTWSGLSPLVLSACSVLSTEQEDEFDFERKTQKHVSEHERNSERLYG